MMNKDKNVVLNFLVRHIGFETRDVGFIIVNTSLFYDPTDQKWNCVINYYED